MKVWGFKNVLSFGLSETYRVACLRLIHPYVCDVKCTFNGLPERDPDVGFLFPSHGDVHDLGALYSSTLTDEGFVPIRLMYGGVPTSL